jgi:hypothetical protein
MGMEAVGESQIVKGVLPAEYGLAMAGFLNVMTKSGTNQFHGSTVYRFDDSSMTAKDPFLGTSPESTWHQFGGSLGGPLRTNRAFFFAAIESYRQTTFTSHNLQVPTPEFRRQMLAALPFPETQLFLDPYPLPNQPYATDALLGGFIGTGRKKATDDHFNSRLSVNLAGGSLSTIITLAHPYLATPNAQPDNLRTYESTTRRIATTYVVGRGTWTAETRFGYNKNELFRIDSFNNVKDPNHPETTPYGRRVPFISFPGIPALAREIQSRGAAPTLSFEQQLALVKGPHALKMGGIYFRPAGSRPGEESPTVSFNSLADLLANDPSQIAVTFTLNDFRYHAQNFGFFVQDDWRVTPALVINLGLRYDYYGHYVAVPADPANPAGLYNLDRLDANRHFDENFNFGPLRDPLKPVDSNPVNFGPRVGFAYNPDRQGTTVFRGGIGLMTQPLDQQIFENQTGNTATVPNRTTYTRLEARALGLNWPVYNEDVLRLFQAQSNGRVFVGGLFDPKMKSPSALAISFDVQRAFGSSTVVQTGYLGTRGYNFSMARQYNEVDPPDRSQAKPEPVAGHLLGQLAADHVPFVADLALPTAHARLQCECELHVGQRDGAHGWRHLARVHRRHDGQRSRLLQHRCGVGARLWRRQAQFPGERDLLELHQSGSRREPAGIFSEAGTWPASFERAVGRRSKLPRRRRVRVGLISLGR